MGGFVPVSIHLVIARNEVTKQLIVRLAMTMNGRMTLKKIPSGEGRKIRLLF